MPELPEVETVCRGLSAVLGHGTIAKIETRRAGLRIPFPKDLGKLSGAKITAIRRRAKYILIDTSRAETLIIHLGMSGRLLIRHKGEDAHPEKHDHMVIHMKDGTAVVFNDARRFGLVALSPQGKVDAHKLFAHLGYEPLEKPFNGKSLATLLQNKKIAVKLAIMDQQAVVGVGNIYASEALFLAGISPFRPGSSLTAAECAALAKAIKKVLEKAIKAGGSSLRDYVRTDGELGYFQHHFTVYGRDGEACRNCGTMIEKAVQGGRSTFYCPRCQKDDKKKNKGGPK